MAIKCDDFYHPDDEGGLLWNDPSIDIAWPLYEFGEDEELIISDKDKVWPTLSNI